MNLNIPGINKNKESKTTKKVLPKIDLSKSNLQLKLSIYKENIISLLSGKLLLHELISLNKKVIGTLFIIGLLSSSIYSVTTNYDKFNKKIKQQEINKKLFKIWNDKRLVSSKAYNILNQQYNKKIQGKYTMSSMKLEKELLLLFINKINKSSGKYMNLVLQQFKEDPFSNTLEGKLNIQFNRQIMKPLLVSSFLEEGYFVEELTDTKLIIRKIKE